MTSISLLLVHSLLRSERSFSIGEWLCVLYMCKCLYRLLNTLKYYCAIAFLLSVSLSLSILSNPNDFPFHLSFINLSVTQTLCTRYNTPYARGTLVVLQSFIGLLKCILVTIESDGAYFKLQNTGNRGLLLSQATSSPINCRRFSFQMEQINKVFSITGKEIVTQEKKTLNQKSNQFKVSQQGIFHRNSLRFTRQLYIICQLAHHLYVFISAFLHVYRCRHQIYSALFFTSSFVWKQTRFASM